jgi:AmiR/NasT family two-component response regulator
VIGVINLQNKNPYQFDKTTVKTLQTIVKIITSAFRKVYLERQINFFKNKLEERKIIEKAKGILMEKKS